MQDLPKTIEVPTELQGFLKYINKLGYGEIKNLKVKNGIPESCESTTVIRDIKLNVPSENSKLIFDISRLKPHVRSLLQLLYQLQNGYIQSLEIKDGLPFRVRLAQNAQPEFN